MIVDWVTIKTHLDKEGNDDASYLALIKNFSDLGRFDDADDCKLQYKTLYKNKFESFFDKWLFGYGVRYRNPLFLGLAVIFIFSIIFYVQVVGDFHKLCSLCPIQAVLAFSEALRLSFLSFLATPQGLGGYIWWGILERIFGLIISSAFVVTLAKKVLR